MNTQQEVTKLLNGISDYKQAVTLLQNHYFITEKQARKMITAYSPNIDANIIDKKQAIKIGNLGFMGVSQEEGEKLIKIKKLFNISTIPLEEQKQRRKEWLAHKKTQEWADAIKDAPKVK